MEQRAFAIEMIQPRLKSGQIVSATDHIEFRRKGSVSHFPLTSIRYLEAFYSGLCIHDLIRQRLEKNEHVNFAEIKETLSTLYWSGDLENASSFSSFIELVDGPPEKTGVLTDPFFEYNLASASLGGQILGLSVALFSVAAAFWHWMSPNVHILSVLLIPQTFLTLKTVSGAIINSLLNKKNQTLSLQFSALGLYLKPTNGRPHVISDFEFVARSLITICLVFAGQRFFDNLTIFYEFAGMFLLLAASVCFSPTHNSDLSNYRHFRTSNHHMMKIFAGIYFVLCALLLWSAVEFLLRLFESGIPMNSISNVVHIALFSAGFGVIFDMLDDVESLNERPLRFVPRRLSYRNTSGLGMDQTLRQIPLLQSMPEQAFEEMTRSSQVRHYRGGEIIIRNGEPSTDLYVIVKGEVGIYTRGDDGRRQRVAQLENGAIFGEGGFLLRRPRIGDAYALKNTTLILVRRPSNIDISQKIPEFRLFQRKMWGFQTLSASDMFRETPTEVIGELIQKAQLIEVKDKNVVFTQGDASDALWIIVQGTCRAIIDGKGVRDIGAGEIFGEIGILKRSKRTATIVCMSDSVLLKVDAAHIWDILCCNLNLGLAIQTVARERFFSQSA